MKNVSRWTAFIAVLIYAPSATRAQSTAAVTAPDYWPTIAWRESSPEAQGIDSRELAKAFDFIREHRVPVHGVVLVRNGRIVLDATFFPYQSSDLHDLASGTKSVTATLAGIAIGHHQLEGVGQPVLSLFPQRAIANRDSRKERLSIESLLTMTSGMACDWMRGETTLDDMRASPDWIQYVLDRPMRDEPGKTFAYCSPGMHLLSASISRSTGLSALDYARRELFAPLGITDAVWPADASGVSHGWGDLHLHPRDMAKLGLLWLSGGRWDGTQVIPADQATPPPESSDAKL